MKEVIFLILILGISGFEARQDDLPKSRHQGGQHVRRKRDLSGTTLRVTGILVVPYMTPRTDNRTMPIAHTLSKYEGFVPDLLNLITDRTHIEFDFYVVPDQKFGARKSDGTWTGMIGEVIKRTNDPSGDGADLAAAPLTITSQREEVVDFINPYQHLGLSILTKKPTRRQAPSVSLDVLNPLSAGVWLLILTVFLLVSLLLWLINKYNPYEWGGRHQLGHATLEQAEILGISGSLWFAFSTLQWQGYANSPRSYSARILAGFWFMFVTISLVTYTASLFNCLSWASKVTLPRDRRIIRDLDDLVGRPDYRYGCVVHGSTCRYLTQVGRGDTFDTVRARLTSDAGKKDLVSSTMAGVEKVKSERNYAFIGESTTARFVLSHHCDLTMTHQLFAKRAYGMALRNNTDEAVREALHGAILEMMEEGDIEALEEKWFDSGPCTSNDAGSDNKESEPASREKPAAVSVKMFTGPLVVMVIGIILTIGVTAAEVFYFRLRGRYNPSNQPTDGKLHEDDMNT